MRDKIRLISSAGTGHLLFEKCCLLRFVTRFLSLITHAKAYADLFQEAANSGRAVFP